MLVASRVFPPVLLAEDIVGLQLEVLEVSLAPHVLQQVVVRIAASTRWFRRRWAAAAHKAHRTQHVRPHTYARISMSAVCIYRLSAPDNAAEICFVNHLNAHLCVHLVGLNSGTVHEGAVKEGLGELRGEVLLRRGHPEASDTAFTPRYTWTPIQPVIHQKRAVYPDTADDPCPAPLVARYTDTPGYTGIHRDISIQLYSRYTIHPDTASLCCKGPVKKAILGSPEIFTPTLTVS